MKYEIHMHGGIDHLIEAKDMDINQMGVLTLTDDSGVVATFAMATWSSCIRQAPDKFGEATKAVALS